MLSPSIYAAIDRWIDTHHQEQIRFLQEIVRVPTDTPPGNNAPAAELTASLLGGMGHSVERYPVPQAFLREYGMQSVTNLIVRHRFGDGGPVIALNAHGDAVPPGEGWSKPPYAAVIENGRMVGRGVAVSKSDIAAYTFALEALKTVTQQGAALRGSIELHFTYDEELGGLAGPGYLLEHKFTKPDYVICASFAYAIVTAHNGCLQFEITVNGKAAHGAMPETGHDALHAAVRILNALYALVPDLKTTKSTIAGIDAPTLVVGLIDGGTNTNVVPDKVTFRFERRMIPEENPADVEAHLRRVIADATIDVPGIQVDTRRLLLAHALTPQPGQEILVRLLQRHAQVILGERIPVVGVPLYTDGRLYGEHGCAVVLYGAGPRTFLEANAKQPDENLSLDDLRRATKVVARAVGDLLSA